MRTVTAVPASGAGLWKGLRPRLPLARRMLSLSSATAMLRSCAMIAGSACGAEGCFSMAAVAGLAGGQGERRRDSGATSPPARRISSRTAPANATAPGVSLCTRMEST